MSKTYITWEELEYDVTTLSLLLEDTDFTCIVGIANGGMIPATLLAKRLNIKKLYSCNCKSYQNDEPRTGAHDITDTVDLISFPSWEELKDENVLIVDDLVDTGFTINTIDQHISTMGDFGWSTATLYFKPKTIITPSYTVKQFSNDEWIVFPWET
tara:strand:+ start:202 stop:669 length:468 start_codon:yes stop_codon:yes gene_type:complete